MRVDDRAETNLIKIAPSMIKRPWAILSPASVRALIASDGAVPPGITVQPCQPASTRGSWMLKAVRAMVERAAATDGLKLTVNGFLLRAEVKVLYDQAGGPIAFKEAYTGIPMSTNEGDILPIYMARVTAQKAGLLRRQGKTLQATKRGLSLLGDEKAGELLARLTETALWTMRLDQFDGIMFAEWPQDHVGVALWSLGQVAQDWQDSNALWQTCTLPFDADEDIPPALWPSAFFCRILRPALWLGLLEGEQRAMPKPVATTMVVRKSSLFDEMLSFRVDRAEGPAGHL